MNSQKLKSNWLKLSGIGLALVGAGVCLILESAHLKHTGAETITWVLAGTGSLMVFNAGLSIFGSAIIARIKYLKSIGKWD